MRPDGLSSTALNRGLHLHESRDLPFPFFPLSSFYSLLRSGSGVPKGLQGNKAGRVDTGERVFLLPATHQTGRSALTKEGEMMNYTLGNS